MPDGGVRRPQGGAFPPAADRAGGPVAETASHRLCMRCGFEVPPKAWGCKNPCRNCGFVYPLGDCSD